MGKIKRLYEELSSILSDLIVDKQLDPNTPENKIELDIINASQPEELFDYADSSGRILDLMADVIREEKLRSYREDIEQILKEEGYPVT